MLVDAINIKQEAERGEAACFLLELKDFLKGRVDGDKREEIYRHMKKIAVMNGYIREDDME